MYGNWYPSRRKASAFKEFTPSGAIDSEVTYCKSMIYGKYFILLSTLLSINTGKNWCISIQYLL